MPVLAPPYLVLFLRKRRRFTTKPSRIHKIIHIIAYPGRSKYLCLLLDTLTLLLLTLIHSWTNDFSPWTRNHISGYFVLDSHPDIEEGF